MAKMKSLIMILFINGRARFSLLIIFLFIIFVHNSNAQTMLAKQNEVKMDTATFGAGCFWCVEAIFSRVRGVLEVQSGFSGGSIKNPSYKEVCTGKTGHAEVCQVVFDPQQVKYIELLEMFWKIHDPTTLNRQGNDIGTQYRSVIYYHDREQQKVATEMKKRLNEGNIWESPVVTEISAFEVFYPAEDYHSDYYDSNPNQPYCRFVITPKVEKFEKVFREYLR
jgi:peptide-methionine (S)-S-oxide reductase